MSHHGPSMHPLAFPTSAVFIYLFIFILFWGGGSPYFSAMVLKLWCRPKHEYIFFFLVLNSLSNSEHCPPVSYVYSAAQQKTKHFDLHF